MLKSKKDFLVLKEKVWPRRTPELDAGEYWVRIGVTLGTLTFQGPGLDGVPMAYYGRAGITEYPR